MVTTILVVDDSQVERLLAEAMLRKNPNYRVELAENGADALEKVEANPPDLVVTDLMMPHMDGLELVRTMRRRHPEIPVILMTAYGDEATAVEALAAGAASYVPKVRKAERLLETVGRVAEHAAADRSREQLAQCVLEYHCRFLLENDLAQIRALVEHVERTLAGIGFTDTVERIRMGEALEEALLNALYHGNLEISHEELAQVRAELDEHLLHRLIEERCRDPKISRRRILVVVHVAPSEARFVIRDEGPGFNVTLTTPSESADRFEAGDHRGLTLIRALMDEVSFNRVGNELTLRKRQRIPAADPIDE